MNLRTARPSSRYVMVSLGVFAALSGRAQTDTTPHPDFLANNTVLVIRHAEKPAQGRELTPEGEARAQAYVRYFEPFHQDGFDLRVDALYAGADSEGSIRPRLTLEPLSHASGLPLDTSIGTKDPVALVALLRSTQHGTHPLVCWRHGQIPALLAAFGASTALIPGGKWPDTRYDWVVALRFDGSGRLVSARLLTEDLVVNPAASVTAH